MFQAKILFTTDGGRYVVKLAPGGYLVVAVPLGEPVAWCVRLDAACAVAASREWTDACDEAERTR